MVFVDGFRIVLKETYENDAQVLRETRYVEGHATVVELCIFFDDHDPTEVEHHLVERVDSEECDQKHIFVGVVVGDDEVDGLENHSQP